MPLPPWLLAVAFCPWAVGMRVAGAVLLNVVNLANNVAILSLKQ
jgi:hypothetical protein